MSAAQLLGPPDFSPRAAATAEEPFWGLVHPTAGGAKPRLDVGGVWGSEVVCPSGRRNAGHGVYRLPENSHAVRKT